MRRLLSPTAAATMQKVGSRDQASSGLDSTISTNTASTSSSFVSSPSRRTPTCDQASSIASAPDHIEPLEGTSRWDEDAAICSICNLPLGRRRLRPRHHCRICGRCVCASCSPNTIQLTGHGKELQRACTPCIAIAQRAPLLKARVSQIGARLISLGNSNSVPMTIPVGSLDAMLALCEDAILPLESMQERFAAAQEQAERAVAEATQERERSRRLDSRLRAGREILACLEQRLRRALTKVENRAGTSSSETVEDQQQRRLQQRTLEEVIAQCVDLVSRLDAAPRVTSLPPVISANVWEPNTPTCGICDSKLGKRFFRPRHHCRLCGRCVCGACSTSLVPLAGSSSKRERCCDICIEPVSCSESIRQQLVRIAERVAPGASTSAGHEVRSLAKILSRCELALALAPQQETTVAGQSR